MLSRLRHAALVTLGSSLAVLLMAPPVRALPLPTSMVLDQYAIVSAGPGTSIMMNSGPVNGKVLVGNGTSVSSAGGGNGNIVGGVDVSPPVSGCGNNPLMPTCFSSLATRPTNTLVSPDVALTAVSDADALSVAARNLTPTVGPLGNISGTQTFTGNGGLNVIDIGTWGSPAPIFVGGPDDFFVINLQTFGTSSTPFVLGGVLPSHILWNFLGSNTTVFQTSGCGSPPFCQAGTFLATGSAARFQFSNLRLNGQLINTGGHIQHNSGSMIPFFSPFTPPAAPPAVPEPATLTLFGAGLALLASRRKRATEI